MRISDWSSDVCSSDLILTEWNEFRGLHMKRVKELMKAPVMIDLRNIYNPADMRAARLSYSSAGRPQAAPDASSMEMALSHDTRSPHRFDPSVLRDDRRCVVPGTSVSIRVVCVAALIKKK